MKHSSNIFLKIAFSFLLTVMALPSIAQSWKPVGAPNFGVGNVFKSIVDSAGNLYVSVIDSTHRNNTYDACVYKYDGISWAKLGNADYSNNASAQMTCMALDSMGHVYVAYLDSLLGDRVTVKKFDGNNWTAVGMEGFSDTASYNLSMAVDALGVPYVMYSETPLNYRVSVRKFDGTSWVDVGTRAIFYETIFGNYTSNFQVAVSPDHTPYVMFSDPNYSGTVSVIKFDGTDWAYVGPPNNLSTPIQNAKGYAIAFNKSGVPHISFVVQSNNSYYMQVLQWVDPYWYLKTDSLNVPTVYPPNLIFGSTGKLYVSSDVFPQPRIETYTNTSGWINEVAGARLGNAILSNTTALDSADNIYVTYCETGSYLMSAVKYHVYPYATDTVWPGDINNDGVADNMDVLDIGVAYGDTGVVRTGATTAWTAQACSHWAKAYMDGTNHNHADADGDGTVNAFDTTAIIANYGLTHAKNNNTQRAVGSPPIYLNWTNSTATVTTGDTLHFDVMLGSASVTADDLMGVAFSISYTDGFVDRSTVKTNYAGSWLGSVDTLVTLAKPVTGAIDVALVRNDHNSKNGSGKIASFSFVAGSINSPDTMLQVPVFISDVKAINQIGQAKTLDYSQADTINLRNIYLDIDNTAFNQDVSISPNPTKGSIRITADKQIDSYIVYNPQGQQVLAATQVNSTSSVVDMSTLTQGVYIIKVQSSGTTNTAKVVLMH